MVKEDRSVQHGSKRAVQRFNGSFEHAVLPDPLPQAALDILITLGAGGVAGEAMAAAGVVKSDVSYWVKRFIQAGALILDVSQSAKTLCKPKGEQHYGPGIPRYYTLTPYGSKLLAMSEERLRLPVVFEDMPVKFSVLRWEPFGAIDWENLGQPRNWVKRGFRVTGVRVVKTSKSVIIHPGPLKGFDVDQLEVDSGRIVERVRYILEVKHDMLLSDECEFLHGPMWQVFRPEAKEWIKGGSVRIPGVGNLDASPKPSKSGVRDPLNKVPHVEFADKFHAAVAASWPVVASDPEKRLASAAPLFPLYLEEVHRMVACLVSQVEILSSKVGAFESFESQVSTIICDLGKLGSALGKLENLEKIGASLKSNEVALRRITEILSKLVNVEGQGLQEKVEDRKGSGDRDYVC